MGGVGRWQSRKISVSQAQSGDFAHSSCCPHAYACCLSSLGGTPRCCCHEGVNDDMLKSKLEPVDSSGGEACQAHAPGTTLGTARCSEALLNDSMINILRGKKGKAT
jgi:hypothetical protein